jgi:hypothetical protein
VWGSVGLGGCVGLRGRWQASLWKSSHQGFIVAYEAQVCGCMLECGRVRVRRGRCVPLCGLGHLGLG